MNVPKIDRDVGMYVYSTDHIGVGGSIKEKPDDFIVREILDDSAFARLTDSGYAVYVLKKQNIDTTHAIRQTGMKLKSLGLKDAKAITIQYVCTTYKSNHINNLKFKKFSIKNIGFVKKPLSKKDMVGNKFVIKINNMVRDPSEFKFDKILNFFGYQRFGSRRPVSHLIGKALVQNDFDKAVDLLLSFTSIHDSTQNTTIRKNITNDYTKALQEVPPQMDLERTILYEMVKHNDSKMAFKALPVSMRRFFVQAYQSFLFNLTLSNSRDENLFDPQDDDVCFDKNHKLGRHNQGQLAIPLVGYSYYKKTRFDSVISTILKSEGVEPKNFFIKEMQEASTDGGFRNSSIYCKDFSLAGDTIQFVLNRGAFATILLREVIKPQDPLGCGF